MSGSDKDSPFGSEWLRQPGNKPAANDDTKKPDYDIIELPSTPSVAIEEIPVPEEPAAAQVIALPPKEDPEPKKPILVEKNSGLTIRNLGKTYGRRPVVRNVSLSLQRGEAVGLLGPNGAGKTTCFYMITGLVTPDYGSIYIDGTDITNLPMYRRARLGIGYLPQEASIFRGLTVEQNIMAVLEVSEESPERRRTLCDELLAEFSITHLRKSPAIALSGGERRRAEIARALAGRPSFILLDEPLAGIDPIAISDVRDLVKHLKDRGIGVLITDHNVRETLDVIDRAYIIHDGSVLMEGTPSDIVNNHEVRRVYLGERFSL
jgi:lipopolysaccharide export system ATP-binding protein